MSAKTKETFTAGGIVVNSNGDVMVVSQNGNSWSLPKGHIDPGEDALAAAKREIYEESGVKSLMLIKELGTYQRYKIAQDGGDDHSELKNITMYHFTTDEMALNPIDPNNPEARWVAPEQVADLLTHRADKEFVRKNLNKLTANS